MDHEQMNTSRSAIEILDRLGIRSIINAGGPNTMHSGSRPRQEALDAMQAMSEVFVNIDELYGYFCVVFF